MTTKSIEPGWMHSLWAGRCTTAFRHRQTPLDLLQPIHIHPIVIDEKTHYVCIIPDAVRPPHGLTIRYDRFGCWMAHNRNEFWRSHPRMHSVAKEMCLRYIYDDENATDDISMELKWMVASVMNPHIIIPSSSPTNYFSSIRTNINTQLSLSELFDAIVARLQKNSMDNVYDTKFNDFCDRKLQAYRDIIVDDNDTATFTQRPLCGIPIAFNPTASSLILNIDISETSQGEDRCDLKNISYHSMVHYDPASIITVLNQWFTENTIHKKWIMVTMSCNDITRSVCLHQADPVLLEYMAIEVQAFASGNHETVMNSL